MTGYDVYKRTLSLSGRSDSAEGGFSQQVLLERMPDIINQICFDLKIDPIKALEDTLNANDKQIDALCYGTAMLLAVSEGESGRNQLFTQIYNAKRAAALSEMTRIEDNMPSVSYGAD